MFHNNDAHLFTKELGKKFGKDDIGVFQEYKEKYGTFNIKINVKLVGVITKDSAKVRKKNSAKAHRQLQLNDIKFI